MTLPRHIYRKTAGQRLFGFVVKSFSAQALLAQIHYWDKVVRKTYPQRQGWFWKTANDWFFELGLSKSQLDTAVKHLLKAGLIEKQNRGYKNRESVWYRLNRSNLAKALNQARSKMKTWVATNYQRSHSHEAGSDFRTRGLKIGTSQNRTPITPQNTHTTPKQKQIANGSSGDFSFLFIPKILGELNLPYFFANANLSQQTMQDIIDITSLQARQGFKSNVGGFIIALVKKAKVDVNLLDISGARAIQYARKQDKIDQKPKVPPKRVLPIPKDAEQQIQLLQQQLASLGTGLKHKVAGLQIKAKIRSLE